MEFLSVDFFKTSMYTTVCFSLEANATPVSAASSRASESFHWILFTGFSGYFLPDSIQPR